MLKKLFFALILTTCFMFNNINIIEAAELNNIEVIETDGSYVMGNADSREVAQKKAIEDAMQNAVLEAGTYIEAYTKVNNYKVTEDEIKMISSGVIKVLKQDIRYETPDKDKWICHAHISAVVNTDNLNNVVKSYLDKKKENAVTSSSSVSSTSDYNHHKPIFNGYNPDSATMQIRNKNDMSKITAPLTNITINQFRNMYPMETNNIEAANDNDNMMYNVYRITNVPNKDYTYVAYDKSGQSLMSLYSVCWNELLNHRIRNIKEMLEIDGMSPVYSNNQVDRKNYNGRYVNIRTETNVYRNYGNNNPIVMKIEYWQDVGFTTIKVQRSNDIFI